MQSFITFLCTTKNGRTERLTVQKAEFTIGRSKECALYMPFPEVSRAHCTVRIRPNHTVEFADVRSSSVGILHNGKYKKQGILNPGDEFFIGDTRFVLVEFAGNVIVAEASADQVRIDDHLSEGLNKAESAMQTALGISLVSGNTAQETGDVMTWSDITAISIAAKNKAPFPTGPVKQQAQPAMGGTLLVAMMATCLLVALIAVAVAIWAVKSRNVADAPAKQPAVAPAAPAASPASVPTRATGARAGVLAEIRAKQAKRDALVQGNNEYAAAATLQDQALVAKIQAIDAKIAAVQKSAQESAQGGPITDEVTRSELESLGEERERLFADQVTAQNAARTYIQDTFTGPMQALDREIAALKEQLGH